VRRLKPEAYFLPGLLLLNLALKLAWLGVNELAGDEPFTVFWSQRTWDQMLRMLQEENNPPLYFLLIKGWSAIVPFEPAWLRVPSAVFSALTVWPLFLLTRRLVGPMTALTACLLFTFSNYHFGFAHEVRAYALFALLATTGMWLLWRAKDQPYGGMLAMLGLSALNAVMVYTHFFGWLAIGVQGLCVLVMPELKQLRRGFLMGVGATLLWFAPYLVVFFDRAGTSIAHGTWLSAPTAEELYNMIWRWSNAPVCAVLFLLIIAVGVWRSKVKAPAIRLGLLWSMVPLTGMFLVSYKVPVFLDRYLVYAAPGFALLVAAAAHHIVQRVRYRHFASASVAAAMLFTFTPWKDNGLHPSRVVEAEMKWCPNSNCRTTIVPYWYSLTYASARNLPVFQDHEAYSAYMDVIGQGAGGLDPITKEHGPDPQDSSVIVIDAGSIYTDPGHRLHRSLREHFARVDSLEADHHVWVFRYRLEPER
jgi:mannosyltransferase